MKKQFLFSLLLTTTAFAYNRPPVHLDLEMTSDEYRAILNQNNMKSVDSDPQIENMIKIGERLSKWIAKINETRTNTTAIRLTSAQTRTGVPIDKPSVYSPKIIGDKLVTIARDLPQEIKDVVLGTGELPGTISIDDETFIKHARLLDKNYQNAARYKSVDQFRTYYISAATRDVRGYYYLTKNKIGAEELKDVHQIPSSKVSDIKEALIKVCQNASLIASACPSRVEKAFENNTLVDLYNDSMPKAEENWHDFFDIPAGGARRDVSWSGSTMTVPFNTPSIAKFEPYLKDNIEDEYRWKGWGLRLNFGSYSSGPRLKFESGVVPHVDGLGGNVITMDSNQPIEEYESQWTIRHEFGHVIGFPDCYHEFYDVNLRAYVNYQLDTTDLMCSRAGNMNERIYLQLKKAYSR
jgi:hypothetical protein